MARLHPRYTEGFTPAVAAAAGIGCAWVLRGGFRQSALALTAVGLVLYGRFLLDSSSTVWLVTLLAALAVLCALALPARVRLRPAALGGALAVAALTLPVDMTIGLISHHESDGGRVGYISPATVKTFSRYLRAHRGGARYEFAAGAATQAAALIVHDVQPVLVLTSFNGRPLISVPRLASLVEQGQVRYAILSGDCGPHEARTMPACSPLAFWVRAHGVDVSRAAGLSRPKLLWQL
jgi:hypothetical protein